MGGQGGGFSTGVNKNLSFAQFATLLVFSYNSTSEFCAISSTPDCGVRSLQLLMNKMEDLLKWLQMVASGAIMDS